MINCNFLNFNQSIVLGTIIEEKQEPRKSILRGIESNILASYDQYLDDFDSLCLKKYSDFKDSEQEKEALKHCYESPTDSFKIIRGKIFNNQPDVLKSLCPYCLLNQPKTIDHFIGKTMFPEYSILLKNLIPCCYDCNQIKDENWRKGKIRHFIHFYNDCFLSYRFLYSKLVFNRGHDVPQIKYFIKKPSAISKYDFNIIKSHFKYLNLLELYSLRANPLISSEVNVINDAILNGDSKHSVINSLLSRFNSLSRSYGVNYWNGVMYETLANNKKIFKLLK